MPTPTNGIAALLWFVVILAAIPVVLWLLKRSPLGGGAASNGMLRSIATLPLSASQRIVTVEVGRGESRRWLVLGVTPQSITTLHTMAPEADDAAPGSAVAAGGPSVSGMSNSGFGQLLDKLRSGRSR